MTQTKAQKAAGLKPKENTIKEIKNTTSKRDLIKIPEWPLELSFIKHLHLFNSSDFEENGNKSFTSKLLKLEKEEQKGLKEFSLFKGECLNRILNIENCIDILTLQFIAGDNNKLKKDILFCFYKHSAPTTFSFKSENFIYFTENRFEFFDEVSTQIKTLNKLITKIISFRNAIAHSYTKEVITKENKKLKYSVFSFRVSDNYSIEYTPEFKEEVLHQISYLEYYMEFIKKTILFDEDDTQQYIKQEKKIALDEFYEITGKPNDGGVNDDTENAIELFEYYCTNNNIGVNRYFDNKGNKK